MVYADTDSVKTEIMKKHLNSIYGKVVYDLDKIYGEDNMEKRKFIVVHDDTAKKAKTIVFCDTISAYTDNMIYVVGGGCVYCKETGRKICELLHSKGVI